MDNRLSSKPNNQAAQDEVINKQRSFWAGIIFTTVALTSFVFSLYLIGRSPIWQVYVISGITAIALAIDILAVVRIWRGQTAFGLQYLFWSLMFTVPPNTLLVTNTTPYLIGIVLLVGFVHVFYLHPRSWRKYYQYGPIVAAVLMALVEIVQPAFRVSLSYQNPLSGSFGPSMLVVLVFSISLLVIQQRTVLAGFLSNISVAGKIIVMAVVLFLGMLGIAVTAYNGAQSLSYQLYNMYDFMLIPITSIDQAETALAEAQFHVMQLLRQDITAGERVDNIQRILEDNQAAKATIARYDAEWVTTTSPDFTKALQDAGKIGLQQREVATLAALHSAINEYESTLTPYLETARTGRPNAEMADSTALALEGARTQLRLLIEINNQFADFSNTDAQAAYQRALLTGGIALGVSLFLGILISFLIVVSITGRLGDLTRGAAALQAGSLDQAVEVIGRDELSVLGTTFNNMAAQLHEFIGTLEQRVAARTKDLATVAEVSTATATILKIDQLLQEVVDLSKERFSLYHSHIYLLDEARENLVLAAGAGEPGRKMVAEGRSIPLNREQSLVARAARERKGVTVNDVTQAPDFLPNPLLPETRSEMAVPMIVAGNVIGVFDVQSDQVGRFSETDISIQTTLAAQVATSIQNVRSFEKTRMQAELESMVNTIGQKIQRATSVEDTLQTAVRELGTAIGASRVKANISRGDHIN